MNRYEQRLHIGCGGNLTFEKQVPATKRVRMYGKWEKVPIKRRDGTVVMRDMYRCDKCKDLICIYTGPSWEQIQAWKKRR